MRSLHSVKVLKLITSAATTSLPRSIDDVVEVYTLEGQNIEILKYSLSTTIVVSTYKNVAFFVDIILEAVNSFTTTPIF
jgi:hypothetical protein